MSQISFSGKTLREKITIAEKLVRELEDHLDNGFTPKVKSLRRSVKDFEPEKSSTASDTIVRDNASGVIASERFTANLINQIVPLFDSIESDFDHIIEG